MKKMTMISMAALLLMAVSCKKDKQQEIENAGSGFRATVEQQNGDSKTLLNGTVVEWNSGDAILVKSSTYTTPRGFTTTGSGATVNFDANETLPTNFYAPPYTGYYPADMFEGDQLTLPDTQDYEENSFANGANPMAAQSESTELQFRNICGVLKLQLYSTTACQVQSISITSNAGEQLCGTGTVTLTGGIPTLTLSAQTGGSTLTLDMGADGAAMSTSESQPTAYYFVVPAGTLGTAFTVKVTETNGKVWSKTANAPANLIARSKITVLPGQAVTTKPDIPDGALPGVFTVSDKGTPNDPTDDVKVYFSQGNLQYVKTTSTWRFAANQWETVETLNQNVGNNYASQDVVSLFGWGTSGYHQESDTYNTNYEPWSTSTSTVNTTYNYYGYGPSTDKTPEGPAGMTPSQGNISGSYYDWGVNNAIINGGNQAGKWRTLTTDEWKYLIDTRKVNGATESGYGKTCVWATVKDGEGKDVNGLIIFPDDYADDTRGLTSIPEGCVFLPAAGRRDGASVRLVGSNGYYWSSSYDGSYSAFYLYFGSGSVYPDVSLYRYYGYSVRLVSEN